MTVRSFKQPTNKSSKSLADGQHPLLRSARAPGISYALPVLTWKSWTLAGGSFWKSRVALAKVGSSLPHFCGDKRAEVILTTFITDSDLGCPQPIKVNCPTPCILYSFQHHLDPPRHLSTGSEKSELSLSPSPSPSLSSTALSLCATQGGAPASSHTRAGSASSPHLCVLPSQLGHPSPSALLEKSSFSSSILYEM